MPDDGERPTSADAGRPTPRGADHPASADAGRPRIVLTRRLGVPAPEPQPVPVDARTVVVAGDAAGPAAAELAERHHLPLLAEPSSGARHGRTLVPGYPALLAEVMTDPDHPLRPQRAIVLGRPTLSRPVLGALLGAEDVEVIVVDPHPDWPDVARRAQLVVPAATGWEESADGPDEAEQDRRRSTLEAWTAAAAAATSSAPAWQARAALAVWEASTPTDTLVLGSSSLVRDLEQHAGGTESRVIANRGLAGIDGTTAMAGGIALAGRRPQGPAAGPDPAGPSVGPDPEHASTGPHVQAPSTGRVRVLVGDLTALHDLTGLIIGPDEQRPELDLIVVDDDGGRIFSGLEHAAAPPALLRRFFTTPHGVDITAAAAALGARAQRASAETLPALLAAPADGLRVLVVQPTSSEDSRNS